MKSRKLRARGVSLLAALSLLATLTVPAAAAPAQEETAAGSVVGSAYSDDPNAYEIYPVPHSVTYPGGQFTMSTDVNVVVGEGVDQYTTAFLRELLERFDRTMTTSAAVVDGKSNIVLAVHGDSDPIPPSAYPDLFTAEDKFDPYLLRADAEENPDGVITIVGKDADCVYYGVATLQMMFTSFNGEKFLPVQIEDHSNTIFRGFIEGFYGGFTYPARESQMRSIRDVKGNLYVFASKTDPYHGNQWSTLYPAEELAEIAHLVEVGKETKVKYTWSVHIGKGGVLGGNNAEISDELYAQRLEQLKAKFQQLYGIGVRSFNVLNDDYNSGTYARQVQLLGDLNAWLKEKGDCMPLIYCCAGYNTSWAGSGAEATALAELDDDIYLYWTGSDVNSPITQANVDWLYDKANQGVVTWLNYPCSEHAKSGLFLGDISHYVKDADGLTHQYGLLSNAIAAPEANKVAYFQLLSWAWNRDNYTDYLEDLWEDSFKYLQPEVYDSYLTIARNVSNCPGSGRIPGGFPESEYIQDALAAVQAAALAGENLAENADAQSLLAEFDHILSAIADFRLNCANTGLKDEVEPWLKSLEGVVTAGRDAILAADALNAGDDSGTWNAFSEGAVALGKWDTYPTSNPNYSSTQTVKAGSKRLQPFASAILSYVEQAMAERFNPGGGLGGEWAPIIRTAGVERANDANAQKMFDGDPATYASYGENQHADDYIGVDLGEVKQVTAVDILQGQSDTHHDYFHKAALEYSVDGDNWVTLVTKVNSHHIQVEDLTVAARYVRLRLLEVGYQGPNFEHNGGANYWTYIREFTVTTKEAEPLYTNAAGVAAQPEKDGSAYTLTLSGVTLDAGEYVGIRLPEITGIQTVTVEGTLPAGVVLEHSVSGETWSQGAPTGVTAMGYVRLRATAAAALENITLTVSEPVQTALSFVDSNVGVHSGAWSNVVDGDKSTQVYTNTRQAYGQYAIFDLGGKQPVHDLTVWIPENGDDIPHNLDVFVGDTADPDGDWTLMAELRDNHYDMDIPYRYFRSDGGGKLGRYIKLAIANVEAINWFYINELEVNTTVEQPEPVRAVSASSGTAANAVDGDLSTFLAPEPGAGYWQKLLQSPTAFTGVTVLRGTSGGTAAVEVEKNGSWQKVGTLTDSATTISLADKGVITGLRITWTAADVPSIAEVIFAGEDGFGAAAPVLYPNIYEQPAQVEGVTVPNGTAVENVPLPDRVSVTMSGGAAASVPVVWSCEDYDPTTAGEYTFTGDFAGTFNPGCFSLTASVTVNPAPNAPSEPEEQNLALEQPAYASGQETSDNSPDKAVDGDPSENSRWNSNYMKVNAENPSWLVVDLGKNVIGITGVSMRYHNLVWPTDYKVQVAGADFTPVDYSEVNGVGSTVNADTFAGNNAGDAACWTTIKTVSGASYDAHPTVTVNSADFEADIPEGTRYLRLYFTGINSAAIGHCVSLWELTVTGTREPSNIDTNIVSLAPASATGTVGTDFADLELPETVIATLGDGSTVRVSVTWDGTDYDADSTDDQTLTGALTLPSGITNTDDLSASLTLTLGAAPTVTGVTLNPASLSVKGGSPFEELELPSQAVAQFSDGSVAVGEVVWDENSYDPGQAGEQTITGTLTANGVTYPVSIPVTVSAVVLDTVRVSFHSNGGSAVASQTVTRGDRATEPEVPIREGFSFAGWYTDEDLTQSYDFSAPVTAPLNLYAKWTENTTQSKPGSIGSSLITVTTTNDDGEKVTTVTKPDGTVTETTQKSDGSVTERVTDPDQNVTITVTDAEGEELVKVELPASIPAPETKFEDVPEDHWAESAINTVAGLGLVKGVENDRYDMVTPMDRGSLATILYRLSNGKSDYAVSFTDVAEGKYYTEGVAWAAKVGVVTGISKDIFAPEQVITREQLAVMLARYAKLLGMDTKAETTSLNAFTDSDKTGTWAVDSVAWCIEKGILRGKGGNVLDPAADVTRAEVAVMLERFIGLIK